MRRMDARYLGVQQGSLVLFSDYKDNGQMWTGEGERELQREVRFAEAFRDPPVVQLSMSMWDMDQATNPRADLSFNRVGPEGFWIVFRTWGDTRIARVRADWTAMGQVIDEDDWQID
ncbi:H-type lectin domain-containing protein [Oceaniglobus trochenteri]|uniref:H-type lectin domain-containing protein n=1 Tax=Oceaniglobus trochenteri TaxID=2763260 RepID=UPI001CFF747B|nr:H-type lectin domain-containing protein [Oceaniglobus trochenteri]